MRHPIDDMSVFRRRRQQLAAQATGAAVIIPAHPEFVRNHDVHFSYRQDSNLFYLTGFEEPGSILVFRPGQDPETVLFVRPKDPLRETWDGFRYGPEAVVSEFKVDGAFSIDEFDRKIVDLLKSVDRIYYRFDIDREFDRKIVDILDRLRRQQGRTGRGFLPIHDSWELIGEMRLFKSSHDSVVLKKACEISARAHLEAMKRTRPGVNERELHGVLIESFFRQGAEREGYGTIVASGANATTLHYVFNDQVCREGDLVLIDAGAEYRYFTGDITRTFPVSGRFTDIQRAVYEGVLQVQKEIIACVRPGFVFRNLQEKAIELLTDLMIELKLLSGSRQDLIEKGDFKKYYPHGVGHWLGMDVHDVGLHIVEGEPRVLEPGMAFTVEPGLYVPVDDSSAPENLRGVGVRIEDNLLVTSSGCEVMTALAPKEVKDLEEVLER